jgi:hypothetical protein
VRVAALYVEAGGVYYGLPDVDPWDEERDARLYVGPWPVVAHPPCGRWCRLAKFVEAVYGHRVGDDGGCFEAALNAVRTFGGVLEHPAHSLAWGAHDLPKPQSSVGWTTALGDPGASCYVEQQMYGDLPVRKATWLYAVGDVLPELRWRLTRDSEGDASRQDEWGGMHGWRDALGKKSASRTPPEFRDALLGIAKASLPLAPLEK